MDKEFQELCERAAAVCRKHGYADQQGASPDSESDFPKNLPRDFPRDLWRDLGRESLMGIVVPERYNGLGLGVTALAAVTEQLVISGAPMGFALSFLIHHLVSHHYIAAHADRSLHGALLPSIATGEKTAAIAVSEPGVGAHPKYLETLAEKEGESLIVSGEKSFVTNAPLADLFIVIALTGRNKQRNLFSAIILPGNTRGLTVGEPMEIGRLYPCPHAALTLERCRAEKTFITGKPDLAFETMVIPFRRLEELMVPVIVSGAMINLFNRTATRLPEELQTREASNLEEMACRLSQMAHTNIKECMNYRNYDFPPARTRKFARTAEQSRQYIRELTLRAKIPPDRDQEQFDKDLTTLLGLFH